jgi:superkiller protein 3
VLVVGWRVAGDRQGGVWKPPDPSAEAPTRLEEADRAYQAFDLARAGALYADALKQDPKSVVARLRIATILHRNSWNETAMALLEEVLQSDPNNTAAHLLRARLYRDEGASDMAVQDYERVLRVDPTNAVAYYYLGTALHASRRIEEALFAYQKAVLADTGLAIPPFENVPFGLLAQVQIGRTYRQLSELQYRQNNPADGMQLLNLALDELRKAQALVVRMKLTEFLDAQSELTNALRQKATLFRRAGVNTESDVLACFEEILQVDPQDVDGWIEAGQIYYRNARSRADLKKAESYLKKAFELDPRDIDALTTLTAIQQDLQHSDAELEKSLRSNP